MTMLLEGSGNVALAEPAKSEVFHLLRLIDEHIKDGRFQRSLAFVTAGSSLVSGLEVGYEHYKGSYSNPIMYTPVLLSGALAVAAAAAVERAEEPSRRS